MPKPGVLFLLCFMAQQSYSQKPDLNALKKMGRESLIAMAVEQLKEPSFNPGNYDRIVVKASKTSLIVDFSLSIRISGKRVCYYDAVSVALVGDGTGMSIQGDCDNPKFYTFPDSDKQKIAFIFDAINKSDEIGHIPGRKLPSDTRMEISEHPTYFYVEVSDWSTYSHYKVNRVTGEISEASHKHYDRSGEKEDEFEIIR